MSLTFEADTLATILRTSEVLANFKITTGNRVIYFGRAVVTNVVHTGDSLICEAKLDDLGPDTAFFLPPAESPANLETAYDAFFQTWQKNYRISDEFKVLVTDVQSYLAGVRHWLEQLEFGMGKSGNTSEPAHTILDAVAPRIIAAFNGRHERFEEIICALPPETRGAHQDFVRRHWHKIFLGSPFGHRTYHKPIGHAGDYEMMNMIYRNQPEGRSLLREIDPPAAGQPVAGKIRAQPHRPARRKHSQRNRPRRPRRKNRAHPECRLRAGARSAGFFAANAS
jgi:extracellular factor (EF) 3-hydroxypalmitic acid methyl ester biosynthesis protein